MKRIGYLSYSIDNPDMLKYHNMGIWEVLTPVSSSNPTLKCYDGGSKDRAFVTIGQCRSAGIPCLVSIYAPWADPAYNTIMNTPALRSALVSNVVAEVKAFGFDGVDNDWECSNRSTAVPANLHAYYKELRAALPGKYLRATENYGRVTLPVETANYLDDIGIMTYDDTPVWYMTLESMIQGLTNWSNAGFPKSKLTAGINMAARPGWVSYRKIVDTYNPPPEANAVGSYTFNGRKLVEEKATWVRDNGYGGVFTYQINLDHTNPAKSLLKAIFDVDTPLPPPPPPQPTEFRLVLSATKGGTTDPPPGSYFITEGQEVIIIAIPDGGYKFKNWSNFENWTNNPTSWPMIEPITIEAVFEELVPPPPPPPTVCQHPSLRCEVCGQVYRPG